jgi:hypothetical protein
LTMSTPTITKGSSCKAICGSIREGETLSLNNDNAF